MFLSYVFSRSLDSEFSASRLRVYITSSTVRTTVTAHTVPRLSPAGWSTRRSVWGARPGGRGNLRNRNRNPRKEFLPYRIRPQCRNVRCAAASDARLGRANDFVFAASLSCRDPRPAIISDSSRRRGVRWSPEILFREWCWVLQGVWPEWWSGQGCKLF